MTDELRCKVQGLDSWQIEAWIMRLGSFPRKRVFHKDYAGSYEKREAHVLQLENGKYALVVEEGCSCYESSQANIEIFQSLFKVRSQFEKWCKEKEAFYDPR